MSVSQLLMTGNMLFEILDPFLMWKQIYFSLRDTIDRAGSADVSSCSVKPRIDADPTSSQSIELARFIIRTFRLHDEEVQKLHAPFVAFAILDLVEARCQPLLRSCFSANTLSFRTRLARNPRFKTPPISPRS